MVLRGVSISVRDAFLPSKMVIPSASEIRRPLNAPFFVALNGPPRSQEICRCASEMHFCRRKWPSRRHPKSTDPLKSMVFVIENGNSEIDRPLKKHVRSPKPPLGGRTKRTLGLSPYREKPLLYCIEKCMLFPVKASAQGSLCPAP